MVIKPITEEMYEESAKTNYYLTEEQKKIVFNEIELARGVFGAKCVKTGFHCYEVHAVIRKDKTEKPRPVGDDTELKERQISFSDLENPFEGE